MNAVIMLSILATCDAGIFYHTKLGDRKPWLADIGTAASTLLDCERACSEHSDCRSILYVSTIKECHRHSGLYTSASPGLVYGPPVVYYEKLSQTTLCSNPPPFACPSDAVDLKAVRLSDCSIAKVRVFSDTTRNFPDAKLKCEAEGGQMYKITTPVKMTFSLNLMRCPAYASFEYWIDGQYNLSTAVWETADGKPLPMSQGDIWYPARPNYPGVENCLQMRKLSFNFLWDDGDCDVLKTAICDMP